MSECPSCKGLAIARWQKALLSPFAPVPCDACGVELTISWSAYLLAIIPSSLIFIFAYFGLEESSVSQYAAYAVGLVVMLVGQIFFMPLSIKQSKSPTD